MQINDDCFSYGTRYILLFQSIAAPPDFWLLAGNFCLDPQQRGPTDSISIKAVLTW